MLQKGQMVEVVKDMSTGFQVGMTVKVVDVHARGAFVLEHTLREEIPEGCKCREQFELTYQSCLRIVREAEELPELKALGGGTSGFDERTKDYNPLLLETFENKHRGRPYWVQLICGEFTSLCPRTGQPDWAEITVSYVPDKLCVESKALKLFIGSFRNHGAFHEDVCNILADDLFKLMEPFYLEVYGRFNPRGGIAIYPYVTRCRENDNEWVDFTEIRNLQFSPMPQKGPVLR